MNATIPMTKISPIAIPNTTPRGTIVRVKWQQQSPPPHEFEAVACPEEEGGFSVFAINYPGVCSQGETVEEAKANVAEAFMAMLESSHQHGEQLEFSFSPWMNVPTNCVRLRIKVDG